MNAPQAPFQKKLILTIILAVAALGIIFAVLATIGDDVPNRLPSATEKSPGN